MSRYSVGAWQMTSMRSSSIIRNRSAASNAPSWRTTAEPQLHGPKRTFQSDFAHPVPAVHQTRSPGRQSTH
ncbi:MAG TPA: hypothetical protein VIM05_09345 [Gaiellaceae bacterium]